MRQDCNPPLGTTRRLSGTERKVAPLKIFHNGGYAAKAVSPSVGCLLFPELEALTRFSTTSVMGQERTRKPAEAKITTHHQRGTIKESDCALKEQFPEAMLGNP